MADSLRCRSPATHVLATEKAGTSKEDQTMKRRFVILIAVASALVSLMPGISAARLAGNHNQTLLRD
jgi:hypothetical protein